MLFLKYFQNSEMGKAFFFLILTVPFVLSACVPAITPSNKSVNSKEFLKEAVVKGFPQVPLIEGAKVLEAYGNKGNYGAAFISDESLSAVIKFYDESFKQLGWEANLKKRSETNYIFEIKNATQKGSVIVNTAADGKKTAITIFVSPR